MPQIWTTPPADDATRNRLEDVLEQSEAELSRLHDQVELHGEYAARARAVAGQLTDNVAPLRSLFDGIRSLHTTATWQGNAATESRSRLDVHELRTTQAVRQIDALIDELVERAQQFERQRSAGLGQIEDLRWQVHLVELELAYTS